MLTLTDLLDETRCFAWLRDGVTPTLLRTPG